MTSTILGCMPVSAGGHIGVTAGVGIARGVPITTRAIGMTRGMIRGFMAMAGATLTIATAGIRPIMVMAGAIPITVIPIMAAVM